MLLGQDTLSLSRKTPACPVVLPVKVMTQAYVTTIAATAITIKSSVARIGDIPLFDFNIFCKLISPNLSVS